MLFKTTFVYFIALFLCSFFSGGLMAQDQPSNGRFIQQPGGVKTWKSDLATKEAAEKVWEAKSKKTPASQKKQNIPMSGSWTAKNLKQKNESAAEDKTVMGRTTVETKKKDINTVVEEVMAEEEADSSSQNQTYSFNE